MDSAVGVVGEFDAEYVPNVAVTFVELHYDGVDLCDNGDSGGPVYTASSALGIVTGCAGSGVDNLLYTAINYVESGLGISVLTSS